VVAGLPGSDPLDEVPADVKSAISDVVLAAVGPGVVAAFFIAQLPLARSCSLRWRSIAASVGA